MSRNCTIRGQWIVLIVLALVTAVFPAACSDKGASINKTTLHVGLAEQGDLNTLDPARAGTTAPITMVLQVYNRLVDISFDGTLGPELAISWSSSEDLLKWEFVLRRDVFFHGPEKRAVTADDVKATIQRALRIPGLGRTLLGDLLEGAQSFIAGQAQTISGITTSDHRLTIRLNRPFAFLPDRLAISLFSIVPADTPDEGDAPPPGTGPYIIDQWDRTRNRITLKKNLQYFSLNPKAPDTIEVYVFADTAAAVQELKAGTIQWLEAGASALDLLRGAAGEKISAKAITGLDYKLVAFNLAKGRFAEPDGAVLAKALNYATDREQLVRMFMGGKPVYGPIPVDPWAERGYRYDQAKALDLVNELLPEKRKFRLLVEPGAESRHLAEALGGQWKQTGIDVALDQGQTDFFPRLANGDFEAALAYFGPMLPTAEQYLWPFRASSRPIPNVMGYVSPEFEAADYALAGSASASDRQAAADRAVEIILKDAPMVWLIQTPRCTATTVAGGVERISGVPKFWTWK